MTRGGHFARRALLLATFSALAVPAYGQDIDCDEKFPELIALTFQGNERIPDDQLAVNVSIIPSSLVRRLFRVTGRQYCLDRAVLASDSARLTRFYDASGFRGTTVVPRVTPRGGNRVAVAFVIDERPPVIIDSSSVTWIAPVATVDTAKLRADLYSQRDSIYNAFRRGDDIRSLERSLRNAGYPDGTVLYGDSLPAAERKARIAFTVYPGQFVRVGQIDIERTGFDSAPPRIKESSVRQLLGFSTGDPYSEESFLEAQRKLYELGTYLTVQIEPDTSRDQATDTIVRIRVRLQEDLTRQLDTELGWASLDCGRVNFRHVNRAFMNTTRRLEVATGATKIGWGRPIQNLLTRPVCNFLSGPDQDGRSLLEKDSIGSSKLNYAVSTTLSQPGSFGGRVVPSVSLYSERVGAFQAYLRETRIGGAFSLTYPRPWLTTIATYSLEYGHTDAEPAVLCFVFQACDNDARDLLTGADHLLAIVSLRASRDRLDDPAMRTRGYLASAEVRSSNRLIGSDSSLTFNKAVLDAAWYRPFLNSGHVIFFRLRGGIVAGGLETNRDRLPPPQERLYTGGATSVRGFQQNELGAVIYVVNQITIDTTGVGGAGQPDTIPSPTPFRVVPVGGNSLVVANLEYRVFDPFIDWIRYTAFLDVGRVWTRGVTKPVGVRLTPGVGVRAYTKVGQFQLNVGYNAYEREAGPAFYNPGISGSGPAPLICVSRGGGGTAGGVGSDCPATYIPARSGGFLGRLILTLSIGPD